MTMSVLTRSTLLLAAAMCLVASASFADAAPKNVILMIGDGMGPNQVKAAQLTRAGATGKLNMQTCAVQTKVNTNNILGEVTDSAGAATALATGVKTKNGYIAMTPEGKLLRTVLESARAAGKSVGLITTVSIPHATPAGFAAHVDKRGNMTRISEQLLSSRADVLFGGGWETFVPKGQPGSRRDDSMDLLARARAKGYQVALTPEQFRKAKDEKLIALFAPGYLTTAPPEPTLREMTEKAIRILSSNPKGFFLMVEGGQIDSRCHENKLAPAIEETLEFDDAIGLALGFARKRGDTLVAITADHETGGLQIETKPDGSWEGKFTTGGHTPVDVCLFADGPGAETMAGATDNTDVPKAIAGLWGLTIGLEGSRRH